MSTHDHKFQKYYRLLLPTMIGVIIALAISLQRLSHFYITPLLFLLIVLIALYNSRRMALIAIAGVCGISFFLHKPTIQPNFYLIWALTSTVFLIIGLLINYEVEKMRKIQRYTEERNAISNISRSLTNTLDLEVLTQRVVDTILELFSAHGCTIYLLHEETRELQPIACKEEKHSPEVMQQILNTRVRVGFGLVGWIAATGKPILSGDAEHDPRAVHIPGTPFDDESVIGVPLQTEGSAFGVLWITKLELHAFNNEDLQLAQIFANQVSIALANAQLYGHVRRLSETDSLTGLLNSRSLSRIAEHLIREAKENASSLAVLFIDCDDFKSINDQFGHPLGDKFLRFFAQVLKQSVRDEDIVIRYAGDEFVIILPDTDLTKAKLVAQRLMEDVRNQRMGDIPSLSTTVSVGLAVYPQHADSAETLIKHADDALYVVKRSGKDQLAVYQEGVVSA
jgi:diguanylate cyclase (GGDEF)-like protein